MPRGAPRVLAAAMSMYVSARPVRRGPAAARSSPRIVSALKANRLVPRVDGRMSPPRRLRSPLRAPAALTRLIASATEKEEDSRDTGCRVRPDEGVPPGPEPEPEPEPEPAAADSSSSRNGADEAARRAALERQKEERRAEEVRRKQQRREQEHRQKQERQKQQKQKQAAAAQQKRAADASQKAQAPAADGSITAYEMEQEIGVLRGRLDGADEVAIPKIVDGKTPGGTEFGVWGAQEDGLLTIRAVLSFPLPGKFIHRTFCDIEFQKRFDDYIKVKDVVAQSGGCDVIYHEMKLPSPLTNRDYVYFRRTHSDEARGEYAMFLRDVPDMGTKYMAVKKKAVRAGRGKHFSHIFIQDKQGGEQGCRMICCMRDNPEGAVPKWLINLASKKSLPGYYKSLELSTATMMMEEGVLTAQEAKRWGVKPPKKK